MSDDLGFTVAVDDDRCQGHGRCYALAPEIFDADDVGNGFLRPGIVWTAALMTGAERAAANCPERAITISPSAAGPESGHGER